MKITHNNHRELIELRKEGVKYINLNGFKEDISYLIGLRLNDAELIKTDELSYETTY